MESQRTFLYIGLAFVTFLIFQQWNIDYNQPEPTNTTIETTQTQSSTNNVGISDVPVTNEAPEERVMVTGPNVIDIETDVFAIKVDARGGDIIDVKLKDYQQTHQSGEYFQLMGQFDGKQYYAQSGLTGRDGPDQPTGRPLYFAAQEKYTLEGDELRVPLTFVDGNGISFTKTYIFTRGKYAVQLEYQINNPTSDTRSVQMYTQLKRTIEELGGMMPTYLGTAYSTTEEKYEKYDFSDIQEKSLNIFTQGGYAALLQHWFVGAWIPDQSSQSNIYTQYLNKANQAIIGIKGPLYDIPAGGNQTISATLYVGPKITENLNEIQENLRLTVDYGMLFFISEPLFSLLNWIYELVGNWGFAIIIITIIVKMLMYPLTKAQYTSMAKMRALQPKMMALKERYGDDRQKMGQATMEMYRKEKVNPMGGCFPMLIQMPIFLALYFVFLESVELRHAEFGLWLTDLSSEDPYFILPILFGASMFLMQKLQPMTIQDPMQQKMMTYMPVVFSVFFIFFPSGLVLYWLVSNLIQIAQALYIYKDLEKKGIKAS